MPLDRSRFRHPNGNGPLIPAPHIDVRLRPPLALQLHTSYPGMLAQFCPACKQPDSSSPDPDHRCSWNHSRFMYVMPGFHGKAEGSTQFAATSAPEITCRLRCHPVEAPLSCLDILHHHIGISLTIRARRPEHYDNRNRKHFCFRPSAQLEC